MSPQSLMGFLFAVYKIRLIYTFLFPDLLYDPADVPSIVTTEKGLEINNYLLISYFSFLSRILGNIPVG
jgi:hypothetical protein